MEGPITQFGDLLRTLARGRVDFVIIGGLAAAMHGSARLTQDLDIVYSRARDNVSRLVDALAPFDPYLRGAPKGLPFRWSVETVLAGLNFTLVSTLGDIDLLGEVTGGGRYEDLQPYSTPVLYEGESCLCVTLPKLIALKRAAGRPKDNEILAELELLLQERGDADR